MRGGEVLIPKGAKITAGSGEYHKGTQDDWQSDHIGPGMAERLVEVLMRNEGSDGELD